MYVTLTAISDLYTAFYKHSKKIQFDTQPSWDCMQTQTWDFSSVFMMCVFLCVLHVCNRIKSHGNTYQTALGCRACMNDELSVAVLCLLDICVDLRFSLQPCSHRGCFVTSSSSFSKQNIFKCIIHDTVQVSQWWYAAEFHARYQDLENQTEDHRIILKDKWKI